jgi:hypothetical protein
MTRFDPEIEDLRDKVSCAVVLEQCPSPFTLDRKGSSRDCLKYRRDYQIIIVNHGGKGWWDPQHDPKGGKGNVFHLVQFLDPSKNFKEVLQYLRPLAGIIPDYTWFPVRSKPPSVSLSVLERWQKRPTIKPGSRTWKYLTNCRGLPRNVLDAATQADALREGPMGSAWFAHRDATNQLTHFEMRGPAYRHSAKGGTKTLFRLPGGPDPSRFVLTEAPIDALSVSALEAIRTDTLYAATGGGMGPATIQNIKQILANLSQHPDALFCSVTEPTSLSRPFGSRSLSLAHNATARHAQNQETRSSPAHQDRA